jgi:hypothetical protein
MRWQDRLWLRFDAWMSSFQDSLFGRVLAWLEVFLP